MGKYDLQIAPERKKVLKVGNVTFRSTYDLQLTQRDLEKAYRELGETEKKRTECLQKLKERLAKNKEVRYRMDDDFLLRFIRYAKFNTDRAYEKLNKFYSMRKKHADIFSLTPELESLLKTGILQIFPYRNEEGLIVFCVKYSGWYNDQISVFDVFRMLNAFANILAAFPSVQIHGIVCIWDFRGYAARHVLLHPGTLKLLVNLLQDTYPLRIKHGFGIYTNPLMQFGYRVIRPFLKKKIVDRFTILGSDLTEMYKCLNPAILPKDCGGTLEETFNFGQLILENLSYLKYDLSFGYETKHQL